MTRPDAPVAGPLHAWLTDAGDLLAMGLVAGAVLGAVVWFAVRDLGVEAADRAAGAGSVEAAGWFWALAEPLAGAPAQVPASKDSDVPASAPPGAAEARSRARTRVA